MPHPTLGLPPHDITAGHPEAAASLRTNRDRIAQLGLATTVRDAAGFAGRYDEDQLRLFLRDNQTHIEQLAKALETGQDYYVTSYGEWLMPMYRRRRVAAVDFLALLAGLQAASGTVLTPAEKKVSDKLFALWAGRVREHQRLPGDHKGNGIIRFFWKGAGVGDDKWI
jgi:hypothetical protein